jgi:hypothetical protein
VKHTSENQTAKKKPLGSTGRAAISSPRLSSYRDSGLIDRRMATATLVLLCALISLAIAEKRPVTFVNQQDTAIELYWKAADYVTRISTLKANSDTTIDSFVGHEFFTVVEAGGKFKRVGPRKVIILLYSSSVAVS